ncbi:hypothetical protein ACFSWE_04025 [Leucobacter albus]|uniref:Uncharacterized protein n=1 Tax=Leucobacter albus TaxID=272210 RepID=A0ABW3TQV0_9MICO
MDRVTQVLDAITDTTKNSGGARLRQKNLLMATPQNQADFGFGTISIALRKMKRESPASGVGASGAFQPEEHKAKRALQVYLYCERKCSESMSDRCFEPNSMNINLRLLAKRRGKMHQCIE